MMSFSDRVKQSEIQAIENQTIAVNFSSAGQKTFNLKGQFTPDVIKVSMSMSVLAVDVDNSFVNPDPAEIAGTPVDRYAGAVVYEAQSNMLPVDTFALCNLTNTYNPTFTYFNTKRNSFQGSYSLECFNINGQTRLDTGIVILHFEFIRYKDK